MVGARCLSNHFLSIQHPVRHLSLLHTDLNDLFAAFPLRTRLVKVPAAPFRSNPGQTEKAAGLPLFRIRPVPEIKMELPDLSPGTFGLMIPRYHYVIKSDDLPILESLFDGLKTAAGADFFMMVSTKNINQAWAAAIGYLKFILEGSGLLITERELRLLLEGLTEVYMNDGSKKELVIKEKNLYMAKGI